MGGGERRYKIRWMWGLGGIWANAGGISWAHLVCQLVQEIPAKLETYKVIFIIILTSFHFWGELSTHLNMRESMFLPIWERRNQSPVLVRFDNSYDQFISRFPISACWDWVALFCLIIVRCSWLSIHQLHYIEWDNFPLFHFAVPPFSPIFQHQKVGWIIENPCDFERSHPNLMLGDGPCQRLHPSHLDDLSISFYLYISQAWSPTLLNC